MAGTRRGYDLVLAGVAGFYGEFFFPVFPVVVGDLDGDGRADGFAVAYSTENMDFVGFDLHAAAAAVALLAAPEFTIDEVEVDCEAGGQAGNERDESFAVRLSGGFETDHNSSDYKGPHFRAISCAQCTADKMQSAAVESQSWAGRLQSPAERMLSTADFADFR